MKTHFIHYSHLSTVLKNPQNISMQRDLSPDRDQTSVSWGNNSGGLNSSLNGSRNSSDGGDVEISSLTSQIDAIKMQQHTLRDQIQQSERNLTAQHTVNRHFPIFQGRALELFCNIFRFWNNDGISIVCCIFAN